MTVLCWCMRCTALDSNASKPQKALYVVADRTLVVNPNDSNCLLVLGLNLCQEEMEYIDNPFSLRLTEDHTERCLTTLEMNDVFVALIPWFNRCYVARHAMKQVNFGYFSVTCSRDPLGGLCKAACLTQRLINQEAWNAFDRTGKMAEGAYTRAPKTRM